MRCASKKIDAMCEATFCARGRIEDRDRSIRDRDLAALVRVILKRGFAEQTTLNERTKHQTMSHDAEMTSAFALGEILEPMRLDQAPNSVDPSMEDLPALTFRRRVVRGEGVEV